jgi:hypothetical protein
MSALECGDASGLHVLDLPVVAGMLINHRWHNLASSWGGTVATGAFLVLLLQTPLLILEYVAELRLIAVPSLGWVSLLFLILPQAICLAR